MQVVTASTDTPKPHRRWVKWLVGAVVTIVVLLAAAVVVFVVATRNPQVGAFYDQPDDPVGAPGTIIRSEPFTDGLPDGVRAWKVLYASTDPQDRPIAVSGLVFAPTDPPPGPRPVLVWSHGTTGIARPCAPSNTKDPFEGVPDMTGVVNQGWVITTTDYPGLGTEGPHPYLVGESEGRAVLDSVRAAHQLDIGVPLEDRYAIWGHSQGGHAALWAGQLAAGYLPEQELVGVAALAPASRLADNLAAVEGTQAGNILTILAVDSWTKYYDDIPDGTLVADARKPAERIGKNCINQPSRFRLLANALALPDKVLAIDPSTNPVWKGHLDANTPSPDGVPGPVFVGQGLADEIVAPAVTTSFVEARCQAGATTTWKTYPNVTHAGVVGPGGADALNWTIDRFAGAPLTSTCPS